MRIKVGDLKRVIKEMLNEDEQDDLLSKTQPEQEDSLDMQVDRLLAGYEKNAKHSKAEGLDFRMVTRRFLSEVEGEEQAPDVDAGVGKEPSTKRTADDLDVVSFANDVARLIANYDSLIEVRSTLVRRASSFLSKVYSPDVVQSFERSIEDEHGIVPGKNTLDVQDDKYPAPVADRAGGPAGGATGGAPA